MSDCFAQTDGRKSLEEADNFLLGSFIPNAMTVVGAWHDRVSFRANPGCGHELVPCNRRWNGGGSQVLLSFLAANV